MGIEQPRRDNEGDQGDFQDSNRNLHASSDANAHVIDTAKGQNQTEGKNLPILDGQGAD